MKGSQKRNIFSAGCSHFSTSGVSVVYAEVHAGWTGLDSRPDGYLNRAKSRRQLTNWRGSCTPEEMCFFSWNHLSHVKEAICERFFLLNVPPLVWYKTL